MATKLDECMGAKAGNCMAAELAECMVAKLGNSGSAITNGREPRSCLGQVFNFKLGSYTDNTKIAQHANGHF
jgi:hypothetical protein